MHYFCCEENRRDLVSNADINGIDFIEVQDDPASLNEDRQRTLHLHFINALNGLALINDNIVIHGGERIKAVNVIGITADAEPNVIEIEVDRAGDFSIYTLCLVVGGSNTEPPVGIDPALASVDFSFKVECPSDFDCEPVRLCPPETKSKPPINYLAKDYASFRRLMLDRMSLIAPDWQRRNAADLGMTLVEMLAYAADHLSYQQDAIQTEGYFDLARHRVSVKRHARLVDYHMHDGCNARTWVQVQVNADTVLDHTFMVDGQSAVTQFLTALENTDLRIRPNTPAHRKALKSKPLVFEPVALLEPKNSQGDSDQFKTIELFNAHNIMNFYTWSDSQCCLPKGSIRATLSGHFNQLQVHDVLVFEEVMGPLTGLAEDADPNHRHALKLFEFELNVDPVTGSPITEIIWQDEDALPFAVCISSTTDEQHDSVEINNVSVVRGNIVLCDHGRTTAEALLPVVPEPSLEYRTVKQGDRCEHTNAQAVPLRYRPGLLGLPLTHATEYRYFDDSANDALIKQSGGARPAISLQDEVSPNNPVWFPVTDLLNSNAADRHFVVDTENDGQVTLRFGKFPHGQPPEAGIEFTARYRMGNGIAGNIGVDAIGHAVTLNTEITGVRNLLAGRGGEMMESVDSVRSKAPYAYRIQERAVTESDYAEVTERQNDIQKAQGTFRWTGSWHTAFLTIDRKLGLAVDQPFRELVRESVERYRMAGHDLNVDAPRFVPLQIEMFICVKPNYFRSEVKRVLVDLFSSRTLANGQRGLFHADNFTFGQTVYLSPLYEAAQSVAGVDSVEIIAFQRLHQNNNTALTEGKLILDRLEIAQLENNPNFRERGIFSLQLGGGK